MTVWYTSDLHILGTIIAASRGCFKYKDPNDKSAGLMGDPQVFINRMSKKWCEYVQPKDSVWVLGDLSEAETVAELEQVMAVLNRLPGTKHLVSGNHDVIHPMWENCEKWKSLYSLAFKSVQPSKQHLIAGHRVQLSHFPYADPRNKREDDVRQWRPPNLGGWLLHGHTHVRRIWTPGTKMIHVGWDAWKRPVSKDEIVKVIEVGGEGYGKTKPRSRGRWPKVVGE